MRKLLFLLLAIWLNAAFAQSASYQDADSPGEAVGMMNTSVVAAAKMLGECSVRFPNLADSMRENYDAWMRRESRAIRITQYHWARMSERDPSLKKMAPYVESVVVRNIENIASAPASEETKNDVLQQYCSKHFADLSSGIWRSRTPRAYKYLDDAPDRP